MKAKINFLYTIGRLIAKPFVILFFLLKIDNKYKFPKSGKLIICGNHSSLMDPVILAIVQGRHIHYMAKVELFKNFLLGKILKALGAFPVTREKRDIKSLNTAEDILENDGVLGIFFEGTRSKDGNLLKPKAGAAMLSYKTGAPILPVCINRIAGGPVRIFHKTKITIGDLVFPKELEKPSRSDLKEMTCAVMDQISAMKGIQGEIDQ